MLSILNTMFQRWILPKKAVYLVGVKGAEREDPPLQGGDESEAALRHPLGEITGNYILL